MTSNERYIDNRESRWSISMPTLEDPTLIVCPKCSGKGAVVPFSGEKLRASCANCGFSKNQRENSHGFYWYDENPTDGYFGYNLWLQIDCGGNSLWAFNNRHLNFLVSYVNTKLRQRSNDIEWGWQNSSLISRLPKWIKSAKNRELIIKSLQALRARV